MTEKLEEEIVEIVQGELGDLGICACDHCKVDIRQFATKACKNILNQLLALKTFDT